MPHFNHGAVMWMPKTKSSPSHLVLNRTAKSELAHTWEEGGTKYRAMEEGGTKYSAMGMIKHIRYVHLVPLVMGHASL